MKFTTDGLIIRENNVGENDRVVVILTRDRGLLSAFVGGARKPNAKNAAATALLTYSSFSVTSKGETNRITESEVNDVFFGLRSDITKLGLAQYICELCLVLVPYGVESEDFLRLALNSLHFIEKDRQDIYSLKAVTELRMMTVAGYMPDLVGCRECGSDAEFPLFLDLNGGEMICGKCKQSADARGAFAELDRTTLSAMRHICFSELAKLYSFSVPVAAAKYLSYVTERYLTAQTGHRFKTLDFFHSVENVL